jgi:hypothetical protein
MPFIDAIPLEIQELILDFLAASEDNDNLPSIKSCALVCQEFLPLCRKHIFSSIVLNSDQPECYHTGTTRTFGRLLSSNPEIANLIRTLDYTITDKDLSNPPQSIQACLNKNL